METPSEPISANRPAPKTYAATSVEQEHRHDAQEQAGDPQNLHGAGQVEPPPQVVDLGGRQVGTVLEVLRFERADQLGVGEKPVGVGQQDQRNGGKEQRGDGECEFFHSERIIVSSGQRYD